MRDASTSSSATSRAPPPWTASSPPTSRTAPAAGSPPPSSPPTWPSAMPATELTPERRTALAAFYAAHHSQLAGRVDRRVRGLDHEIVADACGFAWLQL